MATEADVRPPGAGRGAEIRGAAVWLVPSALVLWGVLCGIGYLLTHPLRDSAFERWDASVDRWLAARRSSTWNTVTHWLTYAAETLTVIAVGLVFFIVLRIALGRWRESIFLAVALVGEVTIFVSTTAMIDRARPPVQHLDAGAADLELPVRPHRGSSSPVRRAGHHRRSGVYSGVAAQSRARPRLRGADLRCCGAALPGHALPDGCHGWRRSGNRLVGHHVCGDPSRAEVARGRPANARTCNRARRRSGCAVKPAVVCNPVTIQDPEGLRVELKRRTAGAELIWLETSEDDPGRGQTQQAVAAGADLLLVAGGDGTVAACAGALVGTGVPMALVPTGTGNLLARNLDIPLEVPAALDLAFGDERRPIDVLEADGTRFVVMAGLGFDAAMIRHTGDQAKSKHGWTAYISGGLARAAQHAARDLRRDRRCADKRRHLNAIGVVVGNVGRLQAGIALLPDADPADGLLDVIVLQPRTWLGTIRLAWNIVRRRPDAGRQAQVLRGQRVEIRADRPVPAQFDGEYDGERDSLTVTVLPRSVTLCAAT